MRLLLGALTLFVGLLLVPTALAPEPARAQTACIAVVLDRIEPNSGPAGTSAVVAWNHGSEGPLVTATMDGSTVLADGVKQEKVDDCFRGVRVTIPSDAKPGPHTIVVSCAFCLVAYDYAKVTFTVTGESSPTPTPGATPTRPPAPGPPNTGSGSADVGVPEWLLPAGVVALIASAVAWDARRRFRRLRRD